MADGQTTTPPPADKPTFDWSWIPGAIDSLGTVATDIWGNPVYSGQYTQQNQQTPTNWTNIAIIVIVGLIILAVIMKMFK